MNIIVLDIETKFTFDEVGGREKHEALGVTVAGVYDYTTGKYEAIEENDIARLEERLKLNPLVVGFNIKKFDLPVLKPYLKLDIAAVRAFDIMEEIQNVVGHRIGLDAVAKATLGAGKSGDGMDAIRFYRSGEIERLKKYCLDDVRLTKELYEYGCKNKQLFFDSKFGKGRVTVRLDWELPGTEENKAQMSLFS
jgi:DEAD/DEAH box helicase domain-containing protein